MADVKPPSEPQTLYCANHPNVETVLRCNRCNKPICVKCAVRTPVGYRCRECVNQQQAIYYTATARDYVLSAGLSAIYGVVAGAVLPIVVSFIPFFSWFAMLLAAPALAGGVGGLIRRLIERRRGRYLAVAVCAAVVIGSLIGLLLGAIFASPGRLLINFGIYVVMTVITLYARLR